LVSVFEFQIFTYQPSANERMQIADFLNPMAGDFARRSRPLDAIFEPNPRAHSRARGKIAYATEQGIF